MAKRKSLGRGLDALLSSSSSSGKVEAIGNMKELPVDLLSRGRYQPRVDMRDDTLEQLADSIRSQGVIQPVVVRPLSSAGGEARYEIVAGERRWRAAQLAGLHSVPAIVREIPDDAALAVALIENIQRENLNPIEEARALQKLIGEFEMTHAEAARAVGRSRESVSNLLRLLDLPESVRGMLERRELNMGHARALLGLPAAPLMVKLARQAVERAWSVRETERAVRQLAAQSGKEPREPQAASADPNVKRLETELAETLGAAVQIKTKGRGGRITIRYGSLEELQGILEHIK